MKYKGKIGKLKHIVITDPRYGQEVKGRYEKNNIDGNDWEAELIMYSTPEYGNEFSLLIKRNKYVCELMNTSMYEYYENVKLKKYKIGSDSGYIAFGANDKAEKILSLIDDITPSNCISLRSDGSIGNVDEAINKNGELSFIVFSGVLDDDEMSCDKLLNYIQEQFSIKNLEKEVDNVNFVK